jgi:hypothetical protein
MIKKYSAKKIHLFAFIVIGLLAITAFTTGNTKPKWKSLFDGKTLNNWKVGDNAATFSIEDGKIAVNGNVAQS